MLDYLKAENAYFEAAFGEPQKALVDRLFEEMKGRIKEDLSSVPLADGPRYWWAFQPGAQYRQWFRRKSRGGEQELVFDEVAAAAGLEYFRLGAIAASPDHSMLATLVDDDSSERFKLRIRDLATGADIETVGDIAIGQPVWASDSKAVVFTEDQRALAQRQGQAASPRRGSGQGGGAVRGDRGQGLLGRRRPLARPGLIFISAGDNTSSEVRFVPAGDLLPSRC